MWCALWCALSVWWRALIHRPCDENPTLFWWDVHVHCLDDADMVDSLVVGIRMISSISIVELHHRSFCLSRKIFDRKLDFSCAAVETGQNQGTKYDIHSYLSVWIRLFVLLRNWLKTVMSLSSYSTNQSWLLGIRSSIEVRQKMWQNTCYYKWAHLFISSDKKYNQWHERMTWKIRNQYWYSREWSSNVITTQLCPRPSHPRRWTLTGITWCICAWHINCDGMPCHWRGCHPRLCQQRTRHHCWHAFSRVFVVTCRNNHGNWRLWQMTKYNRHVCKIWSGLMKCHSQSAVLC